MVNEMMRDSNGEPVKAIKDRFKRWNFLRPNLTMKRILL